jgi:hypothetical protein
MIAALLLLSSLTQAAPAFAPEKYEMKLVYVFEGSEPEFLFVVGQSGFKTVEKLKAWLETAPMGTELTWNPGCKRMGKEPLLSDDKAMDDFKKFLKKRKIKFTLVPSG